MVRLAVAKFMSLAGAGRFYERMTRWMVAWWKEIEQGWQMEVRIRKKMRKVKQKLHQSTNSVIVFLSDSKADAALVAFTAIGFYANVNDTLSASLKTFLSRCLGRHVRIFRRKVWTPVIPIRNAEVDPN